MAAMRLDPPLDRFTFDEKELRQFVRSFAERVTPPGFSARERAKAVKALDTQDAEIDRAERAYQQAFKFVQEAHKQSEAAEKTDDDAVKKEYLWEAVQSLNKASAILTILEKNNIEEPA